MDIIGDIPIYWINLNNADKRRENMISQLNRYNKTGHRIEAIDGNQLKRTYKKLTNSCPFLI